MFAGQSSRVILVSGSGFIVQDAPVANVATALAVEPITVASTATAVPAAAVPPRPSVDLSPSLL